VFPREMTKYCLKQNAMIYFSLLERQSFGEAWAEVRLGPTPETAWIGSETEDKIFLLESAVTH
jgi:hypothetical protein